MSAKHLGRSSSPVAVLLAAVALLAAGPVLSGCNGISARGLNAEGVRLYQQAQYDAALQRFDKAAALDPRSADAFYNIAATYHRLGKLENNPQYLAQAERNYRRCLDNDPDHAACHRSLAVLLVEQGRSASAFRLLQNWMVRNPGSPEPKIELARLCEEFGEVAAAENHLLEALAIDSTNPRALTALGHLREREGETLQALANYRRSLMYDNRQPHLATRVATLQNGLAPSSEALLPRAGETRLGALAPHRRY